jgi:hypothetical protein
LRGSNSADIKPVVRGTLKLLQAELEVLGGLCGFSRADGTQPLPGWTGDGLLLLDALYSQLATCEARALPLLQRLFQGAWQPFGEALEAWLFAGEGCLPVGSPFVAELPSDLLDLLPEGRRKQASSLSRSHQLHHSTQRSPRVLMVKKRRQGLKLARNEPTLQEAPLR